MIDFPTQFLFCSLKSFCLHRRWFLENVLALREIRILPHWRDNKVLTFQSRYGMALIVHILLASIVQYVLRFYLAAGWLTMASLTSLTAREPHSDPPWCHCAQDYLLDLTRPSALKLQQTLRDSQHKITYTYLYACVNCSHSPLRNGDATGKDSADEMSRFIDSLFATQPRCSLYIYFNFVLIRAPYFQVALGVATSKYFLFMLGPWSPLACRAGHLYGEAWHLACPAERLSNTEVLDGRSSTDTCVEWLCKGRLFPLEEKNKTLFSLPLVAVVLYLWRPSAPPCCCQPCLGDVWTPSWSSKTTCPCQCVSEFSFHLFVASCSWDHLLMCVRELHCMYISLFLILI